MQTADLNLNWITPQLAVGGRLSNEHLPVLARELGVRHVVDVRVECCDDPALLEGLGLGFLHLPTQDHFAIKPEMLERGVAWVRGHLARNEPVYIHCEHGIGRSVLLVWCVLTAMGDEPRAALERIKAARPRASPSPAQIEAFIEFSERLGKKAPSWDELADVAYENIRPPARESA